MIKFALSLVIVGLAIVFAPRVALAQQPTPTPTPLPAVTQPSTSTQGQIGTTTAERTETVVLAEGGIVLRFVTETDDETGVIAPSDSAEDAHDTVPPPGPLAPPPCADEDHFFSPTSAVDDEAADAPATEAQLLAAINALSDPADADPSGDDDTDEGAASDAEGESTEVALGPVHGCTAAYFCASERIDDIRFGRISGEPDGAYSEYVDGLAEFIAAQFGIVEGTSDDPVNLDQLSDRILDDRLDDTEDKTAMPVFIYCRVRSVNEYFQPLGSIGSIELTHPTYGPRFAWSTTVEDEYNLGGARQEALVALDYMLDANLPQINTLPSQELGYTYVQFPMWLWTEGLLEQPQFEAANDLRTVRLSTRATLSHITWQLGDDTTITCLLSEQRAYDPDSHDPELNDAANTPDCTHTFTKLGDYTITATAHYDVEERLVYLGVADYPVPNAGWVEHPTTATTSISATSEPQEVHEILSVNIPIDMTDEEIAALNASIAAQYNND